MPSADQVPTKSSHSRMPWHKWVVLIAGSTGTALRAVRPTNLHITPASGAISLSREREGFLVMLVPGHHSPGHSGDLVGERDRSNLRWPPCQQSSEPRSVVGAMDLGISNDSKRAGHEQATYIAVALFADTAKPVFASAGVLAGHKADPCREVSAGSERLRICNTGDQSCRQHLGRRRELSSSFMLISLDRCQALINRSN